MQCHSANGKGVQKIFPLLPVVPDWLTTKRTKNVLAYCKYSAAG
jgi:hypothetical protein